MCQATGSRRLFAYVQRMYMHSQGEPQNGTAYAIETVHLTSSEQNTMEKKKRLDDNRGYWQFFYFSEIERSR